jgi:hypothetical protein
MVGKWSMERKGSPRQYDRTLNVLGAFTEMLVMLRKFSFLSST